MSRIEHTYPKQLTDLGQISFFMEYCHPVAVLESTLGGRQGGTEAGSARYVYARCEGEIRTRRSGWYRLIGASTKVARCAQNRCYHPEGDHPA